MKKEFFWDSIWQTVFVVLFIWLLSLIPIENFEVLNPFSKAFGDFELTDVVFAHYKENAKADTNIVLVNIGDDYKTRGDLAEELEIINECKPKVIGIDAFFRKPKNPSDDSALVAAMSKVENLVLVSKVSKYNEQKNRFDTLELSNPMFMKHAESALSNMISEGYDKFRTARDFPTYERVGDTIEYAFSVKIAEIYNPKAAKKILERNNETEIINFIGNFNAGHMEGTVNGSLKFTALDFDQIFQIPKEDLTNILKGKIVLIGYLGKSFNARNSWGEDKFFTPLNPVYIGKAQPDMYGVVVHANIISMILRGDYINSMPESISTVLSVILIFFNVMLFTYLYKKLEIWYDVGNLFLTLFEVALIGFLIGLIFELFDYKFELTLAMIAIALMGNLTEIYHGLIKLVYLKFRKKYVPLSQDKTSEVHEN